MTKVWLAESKHVHTLWKICTENRIIQVIWCDASPKTRFHGANKADTRLIAR